MGFSAFDIALPVIYRQANAFTFYASLKMNVVSATPVICRKNR